MPPVQAAMAARNGTQRTRGASNPLVNNNRLKPGTFRTNVSQGSLATTAEGLLELRWRNALAIAQASDRAGFEALVPLRRWRGYGGAMTFNGRARAQGL
jgi:hypothetical protein